MANVIEIKLHLVKDVVVLMRYSWHAAYYHHHDHCYRYNSIMRHELQLLLLLLNFHLDRVPRRARAPSLHDIQITNISSGAILLSMGIHFFCMHVGRSSSSSSSLSEERRIRSPSTSWFESQSRAKFHFTLTYRLLLLLYSCCHPPPHERYGPIDSHIVGAI